MKVKGGAHKLGQGIDVKARGGYVVGAGSELDGKRYKWLNDMPIGRRRNGCWTRCRRRIPQTRTLANELGDRATKA